MKHPLTIFALLLLSAIAYAENNKKATKSKQDEPIKQQVAKADTAIGLDFSQRIYDPRLGRSLYIDSTMQTK